MADPLFVCYVIEYCIYRSMQEAEACEQTALLFRERGTGKPLSIYRCFKRANWKKKRKQFFTTGSKLWGIRSIWVLQLRSTH